MKHKKFKTRTGFILTAVGSAVGMANVWGFPYKLTSHGGGSFLIWYILFVVLFSYVALSSEYAIGRLSGTGTIGSYEKAWSTRNLGAVGKTLGFLPLLGSLTIAIGYAVIVSYILKSLGDSITGKIFLENSKDWFESFGTVPFSVIPYHLIVIILTLFTCITGAHSIEKANKIMMPLFFILFLLLAIRVAFFPNALGGYQFMFTPNWSEMTNLSTIVSAMGQAFFSLSVTGSGMIVYGAYLDKKEDVVDLAKKTGFFDAISALVAASVMVPSLFAFSENHVGGPDLLFVTLPRILQDIKGGQIFLIVLFLAILFAGISSLQNMFEVILESILYVFPKLKRSFVLVLIGLLTFIPGVFMENIQKWGPWMDTVSIYIIPLGATIGAISWFWILDKKILLEEINRSSDKKYGNLWHYIGKYIYVPLAIILCAIALIKQIAF